MIPDSENSDVTEGGSNYTCACCGYVTLEEVDTNNICPICDWEDDPSQFEHPDYADGANGVSLRKAQVIFRQSDAEIPAGYAINPRWQPLDAEEGKGDYMDAIFAAKDGRYKILVPIALHDGDEMPDDEIDL